MDGMERLVTIELGCLGLGCGTIGLLIGTLIGFGICLVAFLAFR